MVEQGITVAAALCVQFEGVYLRPYLCPAGVWTIGIGSTTYEDGRPVRPTDAPITRDRAMALLMFDLRTKRLPAVLRLCPGLDTYGRLAAIIDFAYNLGNGALKASTLRKRINEKNWPEVKRELMKWVRGGGRVLPGLVKRRSAGSKLI